MQNGEFRPGLYTYMKRTSTDPVRMISFNLPWQLLDRIDRHCYETKIPSRTQFLIRSAEEALDRAIDADAVRKGPERG